MSDKKDGGTAFPQLSYFKNILGQMVLEQKPNGMTLRQYYAGQYLTTFRIPKPGVPASEVAHACFLVADAMIEAENK